MWGEEAGGSPLLWHDLNVRHSCLIRLFPLCSNPPGDDVIQPPFGNLQLKKQSHVL